ncbi:MAG TPA: cystathionine beta-synthase [Phycisphaerae bacterium]|nr:cystathionine beta-synthase [Phycisphaerales bacterium]HRX83533.1 cystathionine beta-synthase [Phycisphaerae bacterium]
MLKACKTILEAIGGTPLVRLNRVAANLPPAIYAKVEMVNPGGSVKDRIAVAMIDEAERTGRLKPGGTIIEATSGNTGVGLAMVAAVRGYRCIFIMPDKMSAEKIRLLKAYGAEVVLTPASAESNSAEGYAGVARRLLNEIPNAFQPDQFSNLHNPQYHYKVTGPEIWEQTEGKITCFVAGIGTGGTISGVGRYLKEQNPDVKVVGADPAGSILSGDHLAPWAVEGIGEDYVPSTFNAQVVDDWVRITDRESFMVARDVARREGILVGGSCGTCIAAALKYARRLGKDDLVVALAPDTGRNYLSKLYSDEWMIEHGYIDSPAESYAVRELIDRHGPRELIIASPEQTGDDAIRLFREHDISQVPVVEDGKVVGALREITLAKMLHDGNDPRHVSVRTIMARPMPTVEDTTDLDEVYRMLMSGNSGVVVMSGGKIVDIVTRIDMVNFWDSMLPTDTGLGDAKAVL